MDASHLNELIDLEESYWWHVAKRRLVTSILTAQLPPPRRILEGGIGSARNLVEFERLGYQVAGLDLMPPAVAHARERGIEDVRQHDLNEPWPVDPESCGAVVLLDVLEHLKDPVAALSQAAGALAPGGGVIFTVPAGPWLYSRWDEALGHFRRYTAREIRRQAEAAGLRVAWVTHWNAFTFPAAAVVRTVERWSPREGGAEFPRVSPAVNRLLLAAAGCERWWVRRTGVPLGLSLVGVLLK